MQELKCPHCGKAFTIDESGYAELIKQVRNREFEQDVHQALEISELRLRTAQERSTSELAQQIQELKGQIDKSEIAKKLAVEEAVKGVSKERDGLKSELDRADLQRGLLEKSLVERYEAQLKDRDGIIDRLKEFRNSLSTKMVGESLEQHCSNQFDMIRATAFPRATFGKDNTVAENSKGDFIFRESTEDGVEFISIMFEMKNESESTKKKKKNSDFLEELDQDRRLKNCEYAVLVSVLEADNELFNTGIVDMSHKYPRMYVVRPQFFIPIISLLRNAALGTVSIKTDLEAARQQNIDIDAFSGNLEKFKRAFERNYGLASKNFKDAIAEINKSIKALENTRDLLNSSMNYLSRANERAQDITIKALTRGNTTMTRKFAELPKDATEPEDTEDNGEV